ncbi:MAG TPA: DNA-3-methyladenine glycosylase I [Candidatus Dormibacteraeota bacterium]
MTMPEVVIGADGRPRCWAISDPLYLTYHDEEWGRPVDNDRRLFEKLCLEGFMSGLSWLTILRKRENFRAAFKDFDPAAVARFTDADVARLMEDQGIVRNRAKIEATINNARRFLELEAEVGSFARYVWGFEKAGPAALSKDLKKRGWAFVGPTTVESFMEAMGILNHHLAGCFVYAEVEELRRRRGR